MSENQDRPQQTTDEARLVRVRQIAAKLAAQNRHIGYCSFGAPCFVECYCWAKAEEMVLARGLPSVNEYNRT